MHIFVHMTAKSKCIYIYAILDIMKFMNMFRGKKWSLKKYHHDFILAIGGLWNTKKAREVFRDKMSHKPVRSSWKGIFPPNWPSTSGHWRLKTYSINTWGGPRIYIFSYTYTYPISYVWAWVVAGNPFVFSSVVWFLPESFSSEANMWAMKKSWLFRVYRLQGIIPPTYIGIIISHKPQ